MYLLVCLKRTKSVWCPPYEEPDRKTLMKTRFPRIFLSKSSHGELLQRKIL